MNNIKEIILKKKEYLKIEEEHKKISAPFIEKLLSIDNSIIELCDHPVDYLACGNYGSEVVCALCNLKLKIGNVIYEGDEYSDTTIRIEKFKEDITDLWTIPEIKLYNNYIEIHYNRKYYESKPSFNELKERFNPMIMELIDMYDQLSIHDSSNLENIVNICSTEQLEKLQTYIKLKLENKI